METINEIFYVQIRYQRSDKSWKDWRKHPDTKYWCPHPDTEYIQAHNVRGKSKEEIKALCAEGITVGEHEEIRLVRQVESVVE